MNGYCYALLNKQSGLVKIGKAHTPKSRINTLLMQGGITQYEVFVSAKVENPSKLENMAHRHFKGMRVIGEWFSITFAEAIDFLKSSEATASNTRRIRATPPEFITLLGLTKLGLQNQNFENALRVTKSFSDWLSERPNYETIIGEDRDFAASSNLHNHSCFSWVLALYMDQHIMKAEAYMRSAYENSQTCPVEAATSMYDDVLRPFMDAMIDEAFPKKVAKASLSN